ncbi:MAG: cytochrome b/b6 domain-containing protein [Gammaproteobacteria bacterium]|nr:cytochrome b/b6 domain-containing protein [Gammaproteobacteria bacterium]
MGGGAERIHRHGRWPRWLHGANALAMLLLIGSGLAIGGRLPASWTALLGGHERLNALHQGLGLALVLAVALLMLVVRGDSCRLLRELLHLHWRELRWPLELLRHAVRPGHHAPPAHDGRLDPLQRLVMLLLLLSAAIVGVAGVGLLLAVDAPRGLLALLVRTHVYVSWLMLGVLALHVLAGSGILSTHRGIARSMFGDGTVPVALAERLWPGWVEAQRRQRRVDRS